MKKFIVTAAMIVATSLDAQACGGFARRAAHAVRSSVVRVTHPFAPRAVIVPAAPLMVLPPAGPIPQPMPQAPPKKVASSTTTTVTTTRTTKTYRSAPTVYAASTYYVPAYRTVRPLLIFGAPGCPGGVCPSRR